jgi:hypothetical protein
MIAKIPQAMKTARSRVIQLCRSSSQGLGGDIAAVYVHNFLRRRLRRKKLRFLENARNEVCDLAIRALGQDIHDLL